MVKNPPEKGETWIRSLGWEDPLEEGIATYSSIRAWRIPRDRGAWWASLWGCKESHTTERRSTAHTLPVQGTRVRSLVPEDPTGQRGQLSPCVPTTEAPVSYSLCSATREATAMRSLCTARKSRLHFPHLEKAHT